MQRGNRGQCALSDKETGETRNRAQCGLSDELARLGLTDAHLDARQARSGLSA